MTTRQEGTASVHRALMNYEDNAQVAPHIELAVA